jgi:hypothetical protein
MNFENFRESTGPLPFHSANYFIVQHEISFLLLLFIVICCFLAGSFKCYSSPCAQISLSDQTFSKLLLSFIKKILKLFHFFGTVTHVITFGLHNFEKHLACSSTPIKYLKIKTVVKILKNNKIVSSRNVHFAIPFLLA